MAKAQYDTAVLYERGQGVPKDRAKAAAWYRRAADQGFALAQSNLGNEYDTGRGVSLDYAAAAAWFRRAADQGLSSAQYNLGLLYEAGRGVPKDDAEASAWLRKSADQGDPYAQFALGRLYALGNGVPQDYVQAHMWLNLAAARLPAGLDRDEAVKARDAVMGGLPLAQLSEAQRLAREWVARPSPITAAASNALLASTPILPPNPGETDTAAASPPPSRSTGSPMVKGLSTVAVLEGRCTKLLAGKYDWSRGCMARMVNETYKNGRSGFTFVVSDLGIIVFSGDQQVKSSEDKVSQTVDTVIFTLLETDGSAMGPPNVLYQPALILTCSGPWARSEGCDA